MDTEALEEPIKLSQLDFPVVGIGASAGGLEAVTAMFQDIEEVTGMAYVLVMHLDPDHESMMAELLAKRTAIPVHQISDGDAVEIDSLHVIPPGSVLRIEDGLFRLDPFEEPRGLRRPIDSFLSSLAHAQGDRAAAVILSGTGGDGTAGMRILKDFGGVCAVQSPEEARYDGMPYSALSTKLVDFTLPVGQLVERLAEYFAGAFDPSVTIDDENVGRELQEICALLKRNAGVDFSGYKEATLFRRLNRRLHLLEIEQIDQYRRHLEEDEKEQADLIREFLINVTSFFREPEVFELVRRTIFRPLIESKSPTDELRIWVPACSSGQEAYTIAMLIDQTCEELGKRPLVRIFATDIDETMIETARRGKYSASAASEIPTHLQKMYVVGMDDRFEVNIRIREMVRFSVHDIIQDPPFSKLDFISCRNLLIYLKEELQSEIFALLHFSLRSQGHLLLQKKAEEDAERLQFALETAEIGVAELDATDRTIKIDDVLASQFGLKEAQALSVDELADLLVENDADLLRDSLAQAIEDEEEYEVDFRVDVKGEPLRWLRMRGLLHTSLDGTKKIIGHTIDVTANHQQQMLVAEMSHRVKNLFAVIAGLVTMAPKNHPDTEVMANTLLDRIIALGTVYDLARKKSVTSALSLESMLSSIIKAHATKQTIALSGPKVEVAPNVLNTLTLVLHELTTNASKYGALSVADGSLNVSWSKTQKGRTKISWRETVPNFKKHKAREGFGSTLISAGVEQLRGKMKRSTTKTGVKVELTLNLSHEDVA